MRGLLLVAGVLAGAILGRLSVPPLDVGPTSVVERPLAAATQAAPRPACPPSASRTVAEASAAEVGRAERDAQVREAEERAALLQTAEEALARERDPARRSDLIREIAARKSQDDLGIAWTWLTQHRADPGYAENVRNLLYQWSYAKPEHVASLLPQVASGEAQAAAAQQLAQLWNRKDPHAYHAWVASLPDGPLKTAARSPY